MVQSELLCALQTIDIPLFTTCPLFKKRLMDTLQNLIRRYVLQYSSLSLLHTLVNSFLLFIYSQSQKTVDLVRELLSMELNYINVRHPDFNGVHMERVRVEATAKVRKVWNEGVMRE